MSLCIIKRPKLDKNKKLGLVLYMLFIVSGSGGEHTYIYIYLLPVPGQYIHNIHGNFQFPKAALMRIEGWILKSYLDKLESLEDEV